MININRYLSTEEFSKAQSFLDRVKSVLATKDCTFMITEKNLIFERQYPLKNDQKIDMIKELTAEDCIDISPNNNHRYQGSEIYVFIRSFTIPAYGERENVKLYIKIYISETKTHDEVIVISFHQEGMHNE